MHTSLNWHTEKDVAAEVPRPIWNNFLERVPEDKHCVTGEQLLKHDLERKEKMSQLKEARVEQANDKFRQLAARARERLEGSANMQGSEKSAWKNSEIAKSRAADKANSTRIRQQENQQMVKQFSKELERINMGTLAAESAERAAGMLPLDGIRRT